MRPNLARACAIVLLLIAAWAQSVVAQTPNPTETLTTLFKEDFEGVFVNDDAVCPQGACEVSTGWGAWFVGRTDSDGTGVNLRPRFVQTVNPRRLKSGAAAQRVFVENGTFTAGMYRVIKNIRIGSRLRFTVQGMAWSTNDESTISSRPSRDVRLRVGIDSSGGDNGKPDPGGAGVVWSNETDARDAYGRFVVETIARSSTVIVFTSATQRDVVRHNEAFWDDALLEIVVSSATVAPAFTATPATPTVAPSATPRVGKRYIVKEGDTLLAIAAEFGKSLADLRTLNGLSEDALLRIDQELIIELPSGAVIPSALPTVSAARSVSGTAQSPFGELCLYAFFDGNFNGLRETGDRREDLVPNVVFNVRTSAGAEVIRSYSSDGVNEPYCIPSLPSGNYRVDAQVSPDLYLATTVLNNVVNVPFGNGRATFAVGLRKRGDGLTLPAADAVGSRVPQFLPGLLGAAAVIAGLIGIVAAIYITINVIFQRRKL